MIGLKSDIISEKINNKGENPYGKNLILNKRR